MSFDFAPQWRELLICNGPLGEFTLEFSMGIPTVYAPTKEIWKKKFPLDHYQDFIDDIEEWCKVNNAKLNITSTASIDIN